MSKDEGNQALEEFEKEEEFVFPHAEDTLLEFLTKKQKTKKEVILCPRCSVVFDKSTEKAFESKLLKFTTIIRKFKKFIIRGKESKIPI